MTEGEKYFGYPREIWDELDAEQKKAARNMYDLNQELSELLAIKANLYWKLNSTSVQPPATD